MSERSLPATAGFASRKGQRLAPPLPLSLDFRQSKHLAASQASPLPSSLFSPGAPSPSAFPAPPLERAAKSSEDLHVMESDGPHAMVWDWLDKNRRTVSAPSLRQLGRKASASSLGRKRAKRKSNASLAGSMVSQESGDTAWETAEEDIIWEDAEESLADETLKDPAISALAEQTAPITPESTKESSSRTFDSERSRWSTLSRRVTHSSAITSPRSSWDVTTATKLGVERIERGSLKSPIHIPTNSSRKSSRSSGVVRQNSGKSDVSKKSGRESPPSRVVPLAFRRTRLKRRSMPVNGHHRFSSRMSDAPMRSHSAEPWSPDGDDNESELLQEPEATFDWAPRPLILDPQRMLASPPSHSALSLTVRPGSQVSRSPSSQSQLSSPLHTLHESTEQPPATPNSSVNTIDQLASTLDLEHEVIALPIEELKQSSKRVQIDVAVQTDPPLLKLPERPTLMDRTLSADSAMSVGSEHSSSPRPAAAIAHKRMSSSPKTERMRKLIDRPKRLSGFGSSPKPAQELANQLAGLPPAAADLGMSMSPNSVASFGAGSRTSLDLRSSNRNSLDLSFASSRHSVDLAHPSRRHSISSVSHSLAPTEPLRIKRALEAPAELEEGSLPPPVPDKSFEEVLRSQGTKKLTARSPVAEESNTAELIGLFRRAESPKLTRASCFGADAFDETQEVSEIPASNKEPAKVPIRTPSPALVETKTKRRGFFGIIRSTSAPVPARRPVSGPILLAETMPAELLARATIAAGPNAVLPTPATELPVFNSTRSRSSRSSKAKKASHSAFDPPLPSPGLLSVASHTSSAEAEPPYVPNPLFAELFKGPLVLSTPEPIADLGGAPGTRKRASSPQGAPTSKSSPPKRKHHRERSQEQRLPPPVPRVPLKVRETERPGGFLVLPQRMSSRSDVSSDDRSFL